MRLNDHLSRTASFPLGLSGGQNMALTRMREQLSGREDRRRPKKMDLPRGRSRNSRFVKRLVWIWLLVSTLA